jgi:hypothetical protein
MKGLTTAAPSALALAGSGCAGSGTAASSLSGSSSCHDWGAATETERNEYTSNQGLQNEISEVCGSSAWASSTVDQVASQLKEMRHE